VVPARSARSLSAVLCREPRLFREHQPQQHRRQQHGHQQLLQQRERDQRRVRQPAGTGSGHRRPDDHVRASAAGGPGRGAGGASDACQRAGGHRSVGRTDGEKRARRCRPRRQAAGTRVRAARRRAHRAACSIGRVCRATAAARCKTGQTARRHCPQGFETCCGRAGTGRQSGDTDTNRAADRAPAGHGTGCQAG